MMHPVEIKSKYIGDPVELERNREFAHSLGYSASMPEGEGTLVVVAGGPSLGHSIVDLMFLYQQGAKILACNGSYQYLLKRKIIPWAMMIMDTDENNHKFLTELHPDTIHLIASRCHPSVFERFADGEYDVRVWDVNANVDEIAAHGRMVKGGKLLTANDGKQAASGSSVAIQALVSGFNMGFRDFEFFGLDSCVMDGKHHAYDQPWNDSKEVWPDPIYVGGESFICKPWMLLQAQDFQRVIKVIHPHVTMRVHGDGLISAILKEGARVQAKKDKALSMTEKQIASAKNEEIWGNDMYRDYSPGAELAPSVLSAMEIKGSLMDYGCGEGKAMDIFAEAGVKVYGCDIATNSHRGKRDVFRACLWDEDDMTALPATDYAFCCDVMEHIPPGRVSEVMGLIYEKTLRGAFFQIATVPDTFGRTIGEVLHLTVRGAEWWERLARKYWSVIRVATGRHHVRLSMWKGGCVPPARDRRLLGGRCDAGAGVVRTPFPRPVSAPAI
jgi:hypothetical protein